LHFALDNDFPDELILEAMKAFTREQVIKALRKAQGDRTAKDFAAAIGVSQPYLSDVYHGRRYPGPRILNVLGLQTAYAPQEQAQP
jgi:hypothetical protein